MRRLGTLAAFLAAAILATGCAVGQRKWGSCAVTGGVIGATVGGITGGVTTNNVIDDPSSAQRAGGIVGGIVGGAAIGALLGHVVCDPLEEEPVVQAPPPPPPPAPETKIGELKGANFAFDSAKLTPEGESRLEDTVAILKKYPDLHVRCEGYTDSIGSDAYNMRLGQRRADTVKDYLESQGIDGSRIRTISHGKSDPVASNDTEAGRAENRRVEVIVDE